jgi:hypothetical protein
MHAVSRLLRKLDAVILVSDCIRMIELSASGDAVLRPALLADEARGVHGI